MSVFPLDGPSVGLWRRRNRLTWAAWFAFALFVALVLAAVAGAGGTFSLALLLALIALVVVIVNPVAGLYVITVAALLGDPVITPWYPIVKIFSSSESVLYVGSRFIFNPLELLIGGVFLGWLLRCMATGRWEFRRGRLFRPIMVFTGFVFLGLIYGLAKGGGDRTAAFWEVRPLLYVPILYILFTNLFQRRRQYEVLYGLVAVTVFVNAVVAFVHYQSLSRPVRDSMESLVTHGATLSMNAVLVIIAGAWMFRSKSQFQRYLLPLMAIPIVAVYLISQRRAAFVALVAAFAVIAILLFWTNRRAFWCVVPAVALVGGAYTAAFWTQTDSMVGFPAQAIKTVIAPDSLSEKDQASDLYRMYEKADVVATIRSSRYLGIGFGHPFLRPVPLPTITPFLLEPYIPHNSFLWLWMKLGAGGFIAVLYLLGRSMIIGASAIRRDPKGPDAAVTLVSVTFVLMYVVFAYVDIAWDLQSVVLLIVAFAHLGSIGRPEAAPSTIKSVPDLATVGS